MACLIASLCIVYTIYLVRGWRYLGRFSDSSFELMVIELFLAHPGQTLIEDAKALMSRMKNMFSSVRDWTRSRKRKRLDRLREKLRDKTDELTRLEAVMAELHSNRTIEELVSFLNQLGPGYWERLYSDLFLDKEEEIGLGPWLRNDMDLDPIQGRWYFEPRFKDAAGAAKDLRHRLASQQSLWRTRRDSLRRDCIQRQAVIEEFERSLGIKSPEAKPEASDKRAQLKKLRTQIAEIRLAEKRLEQDILDEEDQGSSGAHRRKAGVSTDTD